MHSLQWWIPEVAGAHPQNCHTAGRITNNCVVAGEACLRLLEAIKEDFEDKTMISSIMWDILITFCLQCFLRYDVFNDGRAFLVFKVIW